MVVILCFFFIALFTAILLSPKIFPEFKSLEPVSNTKDEKAISASKFYLLQLGSFVNADNAKKYQDEVSATVGDTYLITDAAVSRVIKGIYAEGKLDAVQKELVDKKVVYSKMIFSLNASDLCNKEIIELLSANLQVLNKVSEKDIQSYKSEDLKKWMGTLKEVDSKAVNYQLLKQVKDHTLAYGAEITKDKLNENYKFVFDIFKAIK